MTDYITVIGTQRSGTTVLRALLEEHANISAFGEVFLGRHAHMKECYYHFLKERVKDDIGLIIPSEQNSVQLFDDYLTYLDTIKSPDSDYLLFDCKYNFLQGALSTGEHNWSQAPFLLRQFIRRNFKIIHIVRENVLATYVSSLLSMKNQVWATSDASRIKHRSAEVPTDGLAQTLARRTQEHQHFKQMLARANCLTVIYEKMFDGENFAPAFLQETESFLGIKGLPKKPSLIKIAPPLAQSIENFDEVKKVLTGTEFEALLAG
ncbi:sulfotransferase [Kordiimonas aestuarii]|uniref:sulfotransferase n=1 Tax=Kordiimonas aestuarii TaxID=1005925 RepID=UPI0021CF295A|nr:sulfotransferase [Kordiimonas aestuarii]